MSIKFRKVQDIVVPVMQVPAGVPVVARPIEPIRESKPDAKGKTVNILRVEAPANEDKVYDIVLGKVLQDILEEHFPDASYIGKTLLITKSAEKKGASADTKYYTYELSEVELIDDETGEVA